VKAAGEEGEGRVREMTRLSSLGRRAKKGIGGRVGFPTTGRRKERKRVWSKRTGRARRQTDRQAELGASERQAAVAGVGRSVLRL
jgi:hypothetical protein